MSKKKEEEEKVQEAPQSEAPQSEAPQSAKPEKLANGDRVVILPGNAFVAGRRVMGENEVVEVGKDMPLDVASNLLDAGKVRWA